MLCYPDVDSWGLSHKHQHTLLWDSRCMWSLVMWPGCHGWIVSPASFLHISSHGILGITHLFRAAPPSAHRFMGPCSPWGWPGSCLCFSVSELFVTWFEVMMSSCYLLRLSTGPHLFSCEPCVPESSCDQLIISGR